MAAYWILYSRMVHWTRGLLDCSNYSFEPISVCASLSGVKQPCHGEFHSATERWRKIEDWFSRQYL